MSPNRRLFSQVIFHSCAWRAGNVGCMLQGIRGCIKYIHLGSLNINISKNLCLMRVFAYGRGVMTHRRINAIFCRCSQTIRRCLTLKDVYFFIGCFIFISDRSLRLLVFYDLLAFCRHQQLQRPSSNLISEIVTTYPSPPGCSLAIKLQFGFYFVGKETFLSP